MTKNKTQPTNVSVKIFLDSVSDSRRQEANILIVILKEISGEDPVMWGPSIIGFGIQHYKYNTGRQGDMPKLSFSPRKSAITVYFSEGFDEYQSELKQLGKHKNSVSCLYINKLGDINLEVLKSMFKKSYELATLPRTKITTVDEYIASIPNAARKHFDELRSIVKAKLPQAWEVFSYGIIGYKTSDKRAVVFISGWKDHLAIYPLPKDASLLTDLKPYIKGKGTLWFSLDEPLPKALIKKTIEALAK